MFGGRISPILHDSPLTWRKDRYTLILKTTGVFPLLVHSSSHRNWAWLCHLHEHLNPSLWGLAPGWRMGCNKSPSRDSCHPIPDRLFGYLATVKWSVPSKNILKHPYEHLRKDNHIPNDVQRWGGESLLKGHRNPITAQHQWSKGHNYSWKSSEWFEVKQM